MTEPHDWPLEQSAKGSLRPWYFRATGHLMVLFSDPEEAQRARRGLLERNIPHEELRLYESEEILRIVARLQKERSILAKAVAALVADASVKQRFLDTVRTGGAALWLVASTRDRADHLVGLLAEYGYSFLRYYGEDGVADVERDADQACLRLLGQGDAAKRCYRGSDRAGHELLIYEAAGRRPRTGHPGSRWPTPRFLAIGGANDTGFLATVERYTPATDTWETVAPMSTPQGTPGVVSTAGRIVVVGGAGGVSGAVGPLQSSEVFDPNTNTWPPVDALLPVGRGSLSAERGPGTVILAFGGFEPGVTASARVEALPISQL